MKRFTETEKWHDPWFRQLTGPSKLVFIFLIENCNNAGFYEFDIIHVTYLTGLELKHVEGATKGLVRGIKEADGWVWIKNFLKHQKNADLNPENPAHKQIIGLIKDQVSRFSKVPEFSEFIGPYKGLFSPIGIVKVKKIRKGSAEGKEGFDEFWQSYPNRVAKGDAEAAYAKHECFKILPQILTKLRQLKISDAWTNEGGKFIPYPATWLNRKGWEDELHQSNGNGENGMFLSK